MKSYKHLSKNDRDRIEILRKQGFKQKEMAEVLGCNPSTISREIRRNKKKKKDLYLSDYANQRSVVKRRYSKYQGMKINEDERIKKYIIEGLSLGWSPDVISGRMKEDKVDFYSNKDSIYRWLRTVYGEEYSKYLLTKRKKIKRRQDKTTRTMIPNRVGIEKRPRLHGIGHMEGDTIVNPKRYMTKCSLVVIKDKYSRKVGIEKIYSLKPYDFNDAIRKIQRRMCCFKTLTLDNGVENTKYEKLRIPTYFCNPYSSWEKGQVENINRIIRRYIKKGSDISNHSSDYIRYIENKINNTPRKVLKYKTPDEVFYAKLFKSKQKMQPRKIALEA